MDSNVRLEQFKVFIKEFEDSCKNFPKHIALDQELYIVHASKVASLIYRAQEIWDNDYEKFNPPVFPIKNLYLVGNFYIPTSIINFDIHIENCILNGLNFESVSMKNLIIEQSQFQDSLTIAKSHFNSIKYTNNTIKHGLEFNGNHVELYTIFDNNNFVLPEKSHMNLGFRQNKFNGGFSFFDNIMHNNYILMDFKLSKFNGFQLKAKNGILLPGLNFRKCVFKMQQLDLDKVLGAEFNNTEFRRIVYFNSAKFKAKANFANSNFVYGGDFDRVIFSSTTDFSNCVFGWPPSFHETTFCQDISFENAQFSRCETDEDYRAYRTLKQHMNDVHATLEESRFFALEQRTRLKLDEELYQKGKKELLSNIIISKFYAAISDYGQDTYRPLILLVGMWLLFGLLFSLPGMVDINQKYIEIAWIELFRSDNWIINIIKGLGYSFQSTFNPLSLFAKDIPFIAHNIVVLILAYSELLCAITFIALWLFAVRRRFQKGE